MRELLNKLEQLEHQDFMLEMCDHWTREDYELSARLHKQINEIKEQLKALSK